MSPRFRPLSLPCFAALVATLAAAPEPTKNALPPLPGQTAAAPAPAPTASPATEKKSDAKNSPATSNSTATSTTATPAATDPAATPAATSTEKAPATPATKTKSLFTLPSAAPKTAPTPPPLSPRFLQVRAKIDGLFASRNDPPPPPDARLNPFRPPGALPVASITTKDGAVEPVPVNNNLVLLQQAVATIRVKGKLQIKNSLQLIINTGPGKEGTYKEGDIINVNLAPDPVHLRVRVITANSLTVTLGDAEMSLKF